MSTRKKSGRGLTGRVRASITSYIRDEVRRRPHCCVTWNIYGTPEGTLVVSYLCLNHDAVWKDVFDVTIAATKADTGSTLDSRCPSIREVVTQEVEARPAETSAADTETLNMWGPEDEGMPSSEDPEQGA